MYCGKCGTKMPEDEHICPNCKADMSEPPVYNTTPPKTEKPGFFKRLMDKLKGR